MLKLTFLYSYLITNNLHIGHSRTNSILQASQFIFKVTITFTVINLLLTSLFLKNVLSFFLNILRKRGDFWFINKDISFLHYIKLIALKSGELFFSNSWIPGILTNFKGVSKLLNSFFLKGRFKNHRDVIFFDNFYGFAYWTNFPKSVLILNSTKNTLAFSEVLSLNFIGGVNIVDTNVDSNSLYLSIPSNDDSFKSLNFISKIFSTRLILNKLRLVFFWYRAKIFRISRIFSKFKRFRFIKKFYNWYLKKIIRRGLNRFSNILEKKSFGLLLEDNKQINNLFVYSRFFNILGKFRRFKKIRIRRRFFKSYLYRVRKRKYRKNRKRYAFI